MKSMILLLLAAGMISTALAGDESETKLGKITFPLGKNYVKSAGSLDWNTAKYKMDVCEQDKIKTMKKSRCEVTFKNKKVMRIGENSIVAITKDAAGVEEINMQKGKAWINLFNPTKKKSFKIRTMTSICAVRGTVYRLNTDENHSNYRVYRGTIEVTPLDKDGKSISDSSLFVNAGEELILVMNFEEYKKQQMKAIEDYKKSEEEAFKQFEQKQNEAFENFRKKDEDDFKKFRNVHIKQTRFNVNNEKTDDWVQWNLERDKINRQ